MRIRTKSKKRKKQQHLSRKILATVTQRISNRCICIEQYIHSPGKYANLRAQIKTYIRIYTQIHAQSSTTGGDRLMRKRIYLFRTNSFTYFT